MPNRQPEPLIATVMSLGFTELEAESYVQLCRSAGATGYAIAKAIHKPHANVYQALTALEHKGAVVFEDGATRTYSAVPPSELLELLHVRMQSELSAAKAALASLEQVTAQDEGLYRLRTQAQVSTKALKMVAAARECILLYAPSPLMAELRPDLERAIAAGVRVAGMVVRDEDRLKGARLQLSGIDERIRTEWPDFPLILVVDAREALLAPLTPELQLRPAGMWTRSAFLCALFHNALTSDAILHSLPAISDIVSPNRFLFGMTPSAILEAAWANGAESGRDPVARSVPHFEG